MALTMMPRIYGIVCSGEIEFASQLGRTARGGGEGGERECEGDFTHRIPQSLRRSQPQTNITVKSVANRHSQLRISSLWGEHGMT